MVFQWFPMVANHWSEDGMVTIHRSGLNYDHQITADAEVKVTGSRGRALKAEKLRKIAADFCQQFTSELQQNYQDLILQRSS